jgi:hypothetical protein
MVLYCRGYCSDNITLLQSPPLYSVERQENTETGSAREKTMTIDIPCMRAYGFGLRLV